MSDVHVRCPYCSQEQVVTTAGDYRPFYVNCAQCSRRFIAEPAQSGVLIYRDGEAPCCSDPDCRETEMGTSGDD